MSFETEIREALRDLQHTMERKSQRTEAAEERIAMLEKLLQDHLSACSRQQEELQQILEVVRNVNASMKVANWIRRIVIWSAGLAAALISLYHTWKGQ